MLQAKEEQLQGWEEQIYFEIFKGFCLLKWFWIHSAKKKYRWLMWLIAHVYGVVMTKKSLFGFFVSLLVLVADRYPTMERTLNEHFCFHVTFGSPGLCLDHVLFIWADELGEFWSFVFWFSTLWSNPFNPQNFPLLISNVFWFLSVIVFNQGSSLTLNWLN